MTPFRKTFALREYGGIDNDALPCCWHLFAALAQSYSRKTKQHDTYGTQHLLTKAKKSVNNPRKPQGRNYQIMTPQVPVTGVSGRHSYWRYPLAVASNPASGTGKDNSRSPTRAPESVAWLP